MEFEAFPKIPRYSRDICITEKIDGTNGTIALVECDGHAPYDSITTVDGLSLYVGSRNRWITPKEDNHGFAKWCHDNINDLILLGPGVHRGEWWGQGIQRGYGRSHKSFSLFNTFLWSDQGKRPSCCEVVPLLYQGPMGDDGIDHAISVLRDQGSIASPGFMKPEGIIIYHSAANSYFNKTLDKDEEHKSKVSSVG